MLGHDRFGDHPHRKHDPRRHNDDVIDIAENRHKIRIRSIGDSAYAATHAAVSLAYHGTRAGLERPGKERARRACSASLQVDAVDFLGDSANYAISLFVLCMALRYRASAALCVGTGD
jgi:hypothetical protein